MPRPAKEFTVATPQGQHILLSSLKGKVVVVQFLFTWCPHCQAFSKVLTQFNREYGPRGFQALGVAFEDDVTKDKAVSYAQQYAGFPVGVSTRSTVLGYLGISELERIGVPQIVVIDRKGVIREQSQLAGRRTAGRSGSSEAADREPAGGRRRCERRLRRPGPERRPPRRKPANKEDSPHAHRDCFGTLASSLALQAAAPVPRPTKEFTIILPSGKQNTAFELSRQGGDGGVHVHDLPALPGAFQGHHQAAGGTGSARDSRRWAWPSTTKSIRLTSAPITR